MNNSLKSNSPFYTLTKFKGYKSIFFTFFIFIAIPTLILKSILINQFYLPTISYAISGILYITMFLFINSFIVLHGLSAGRRFSFFHVLKFIPSIIPVIILPVLIFTVLLIIAKSFFLIAPFLLFAFIPIVSFAPLYSKRIALSEIVDNNKSFLKTTIGKSLLKNILILSFILVIIVFILKSLFYGFFSFSGSIIIFSLPIVFIGLLYIISFFVLYITVANTYSNYSFILPDNLYDIANRIIAETKNTRKKRRDISQKKHSHKKESYKENIFDFEKKDKKSENKKTKPKSKEHNRFLEDGEFNRFEDTKF